MNENFFILLIDGVIKLKFPYKQRNIFQTDFLRISPSLLSPDLHLVGSKYIFILENCLQYKTVVSCETIQFILGQIYPIFTLYNQDDDEQLSVTIGGDVSVYYEDTDELPLEENYISFGLSLDDGE